MGTTNKQDQNFREAIGIPDTFLGEAIEWINDNLDPDDVFSDDKLRVWAEKNGYVIPED
jgi:hypothetical protein